MNAAVFLDRDGTIIEDRHYLYQPEGVTLIPGAGEGLFQLSQSGLKLFVVSNQSGVGRGYFSLSDVVRVNERLNELLSLYKVSFDKIYVAPEAPEQPSRGRKPSPQFLFDAHEEFGVDLAASYMIGDKLIDLECGWNAGVKQCLLVRTGSGLGVEQSAPATLARAVVVDHLPAAAQWILRDMTRRI